MSSSVASLISLPVGADGRSFSASGVIAGSPVPSYCSTTETVRSQSTPFDDMETSETHSIGSDVVSKQGSGSSHQSSPLALHHHHQDHSNTPTRMHGGSGGGTCSADDHDELSFQIINVRTDVRHHFDADMVEALCGVDGIPDDGGGGYSLQATDIKGMEISNAVFQAAFNGMMQNVDEQSGRGSPVDDASVGGQPRSCGTPKSLKGQCKVCGDEATGMYFGALVCVPCKTFFLRYAGDGFSFVCKFNKSCEITVATRTQCKFCRYQKCIHAGMYRRVRPAQVQLSAGQQLCVVCHDVANGIHFGAITCEGCKKFFRRGLTEHSSYVCKSGQSCVINPRTRNSCRYCRYQTCLSAGMSREAIQMGRPSKITSENIGHQRPIQPGGGLQQASPMSGKVQGSTFQSSGSWRMMTPYDIAEENTLRWSPHDVDGQQQQQHRRPHHSDSWSSSGVGSEFGVDGGGLAVDDLASPKRRMSDSLMSSSSSQYQFSPANGGAANMDSETARPLTSGHDQMVACSSAGNAGGYLVRSGDSAQWTGASSEGSPRVTYLGGHQFVNGSGGLDLQSKTMPPMRVPQSSSANNVCMWQTPFVIDPIRASGASLYNAAAVVSAQFANRQHHHQPRQLPAALIKSEQQAADVKTSTTDEAGPSAHNIHDLSNQIQHIMNESSAVLANCERTLNFPSSTLRATAAAASVGDHGGTLPTTHQKSLFELHDASVLMNMIGGEASGSSASAGGSSKSHLFGAGTSSASVTGESLLNDDHRAIGLMAAFETTAADIHDYDRLAESLGDGIAHEGLVENYSGEGAMSISSNNPDWMDQMTEHLVKDSIVVGPTDSSRNAQVASAAEKQQAPSNVFVQSLSTGDPELDEQVKSSINYWLHPELPDENVMLASRHWAVLNKVMPAYCRFVQLGNNINKGLKAKFDNWVNSLPDENERQSKLSLWIQQNVVPVYTYSSVSFFNCLPGFAHFTPTDKGILIRCGQSMSRILVAALHWYIAEDRNFRNFLSWRTMKPGQVDRFKLSLIEYADRITAMEVDPIEASMLNALTVIASDYKGLENPTLIEESRTHILGTFRAYTTAKYGTPNRRIEQLFEFIPEVRRLGLIHYKMTQSTTLGVAPNTVDDCTEVTGCSNTSSLAYGGPGTFLGPSDNTDGGAD